MRPSRCIAGAWLAAWLVSASALADADTTRVALDARSSALVSKVRHAYEHVRSLEADFDQVNEWELVEPRTPYKGRLYVQADGRVRLEYTEPAGHVLVADGEWLWTYVPESAQVVKSRVGPQGETVARLFLDFLSGHRVREVQWVDDQAEIVIDPDPELGLSVLRVDVDPKTGIADRFVWTDLEGNTSEYRIRDCRLNVGLDAGLFHFTPPKGVDVVELEG